MTNTKILDEAVRSIAPQIRAYTGCGYGLAIRLGWVLIDDIRAEYRRIVAETREA